MFYRLNPAVALRSWELLPYACTVKGKTDAVALTEAQFSLLSQCLNGEDLPDSPVLEGLRKRKLLLPKQAEAGLPSEEALLKQEKLVSWQKPLAYGNRYFPSLRWMLTGKCNFNCKHCICANDRTRQQSEFTWKQCQLLIEDAETCGIQCFFLTGGEPMLHPRFFDVIQEILNRGMLVEEISTNGYYLTQRALDLLRHMGCVPKIKLSLDCIGHHDWLRQRAGAQEDALGAIRLCLDNGFPVEVQTNVHRKNVSALMTTAQHLDQMGVPRLRVLRTCENPRWMELTGHMALSWVEYYDHMLAFSTAYTKAPHQMEVDIWQLLTLNPKESTFRLQTVRYQKGEMQGHHPASLESRRILGVHANGNLLPCNQLLGTPEQHLANLGNVNTSRLPLLLRQPHLLDTLCLTLETLKARNDICSRCLYFPYCAGGDRDLALQFLGSRLGCDSTKCQFFLNGYLKKTRLALTNYQECNPIPC